MNLVRTLDAAEEPVSLTEVKNQLRVTTTADDDSFRAFIAAARRRVENFLGKTLITSTWELKVDDFSTEICLPMSPIQSITSVEYVDTDGNPQTLDAANYQFDRGGRLRASYGNTWPTAREQMDAVTVTYIAGELHAGYIPPDIRHAILLIIGAADIARENTVIGAGVVVSEIPSGAEYLLSPYKDWKV
jgi:uncharacterized phiE125 gp8 family phage protein